MGTERIKTFVYLNAEKSSVYRAVMRVFTEAKARFALQLPTGVCHHLLLVTRRLPILFIFSFLVSRL